jgi:RHS repeat-associated protein
MSPNAAGDWSGKLELTWDAWSPITAVKSDGVVIGSYHYDALTRTLGSTVWHTYYSNQWKPLEERKNALTTASIHYLWGARHRDDFVRRDRAATGTAFNETRYVMIDYFNPMALTDATGAVTERYAFSAFGKRRILAPDWSSRATSECGMEFGFQGQFLDTESGLMNYGFRYYSPELGRWTCKDPIEELGGLNLYAIAGNDVVNRWDYLGLADESFRKWPSSCEDLKNLLKDGMDSLNQKVKKLQNDVEAANKGRSRFNNPRIPPRQGDPSRMPNPEGTLERIRKHGWEDWKGYRQQAETSCKKLKDVLGLLADCCLSPLAPEGVDKAMELLSDVDSQLCQEPYFPKPAPEIYPEKAPSPSVQPMLIGPIPLSQSQQNAMGIVSGLMGGIGALRGVGSAIRVIAPAF